MFSRISTALRMVSTRLQESNFGQRIQNLSTSNTRLGNLATRVLNAVRNRLPGNNRTAVAAKGHAFSKVNTGQASRSQRSASSSETSSTAPKPSPRFSRGKFTPPQAPPRTGKAAISSKPAPRSSASNSTAQTSTPKAAPRPTRRAPAPPTTSSISNQATITQASAASVQEEAETTAAPQEETVAAFSDPEPQGAASNRDIDDAGSDASDVSEMSDFDDEEVDEVDEFDDQPMDTGGIDARMESLQARMEGVVSAAVNALGQNMTPQSSPATMGRELHSQLNSLMPEVFGKTTAPFFSGPAVGAMVQESVRDVNTTGTPNPGRAMKELRLMGEGLRQEITQIQEQIEAHPESVVSHESSTKVQSELKSAFTQPTLQAQLTAYMQQAQNKDNGS